MSKYSQLFSDTIIFGIGNFTVKFISFFLMPLYTLALTTEEFGLADLLSNSLSLLMPVLTLSISDAVFRFSLEKTIDFRNLLANGIKVLCYSYVIVLLFVVFVYYFSPHTHWLLFAILYVFESFKTLLAQFARGLGKVKLFAASGILGAASLLFFSFLFLKILRLGISGYLLAFIISNLTSILFLIRKKDVRFYISFFVSDNKLLKQMLIYSLPLIPNMLSWWLTNISSRYIIVGYCGLGIAGLFAGASKIPALINIVTSVFQQSWQYSSIKEYQESSESKYYSNVFHYYSFFVIIFSSIILALLPFISRFILLGEFYAAWAYTPLLLFSAMLGCYSIFFGTFYSVVKKNKNAMYSTLIGAVTNISFCFLLIPYIGVSGALIANVTSYLVIVSIRIYDSSKYIRVHIEWHRLILSILLVLCQSIILSISFKGNITISFFITISLLFFYRKDFQYVIHFFKKDTRRK